MRNALKKLMVFSMTGAIALSPMSVMAAEQGEVTTDGASNSTTGTGSVEGYVDKEVFTVVLPTTEEVTKASMAFIIDPQGLIKDTAGAAHENATTTEDKGLYFKNSAGSYSASSDSLTVKNKGTTKVSVKLDATVTGIDGIKLSDSADMTGADPEIYLALKAGEDTTPIAGDSASATVTKTLEALPEGDFKTIYDKGNSSYKFVIDDSKVTDDTSLPSLDFNLTGAANTDTSISWANVTSVNPSVNLTWTLSKLTTAAPSVNSTANFTKGTELNIPVDLGSGDLAATKATVTVGSTSNGSFAANSVVTYSNGKITVAASAFGGASASDKRYIKVLFNDSNKTTKVIELTIAATA